MRIKVQFVIGVGALALSSAPGLQATTILWNVADGGNGHCYELVTAPSIPWKDAMTAAVQKGGYLATLTSEAENRFVFDQLVLPGFGTGNGGSAGVQAWLGGCLNQEGGWNWVTGEAFNSWVNWAPNEPNNVGGVESHNTINRFGDWTWNDEGAWPCGIRGYVIEYERCQQVPDAGATFLLTAVGLAGLGLIRRRLA